VLIDQFALLVIEVFGVRFGELFQRVENRHADGGAGLLLLAPVQDEAFGFQSIQQFFGNLLDLGALRLVEFDVGTGEQIKDGELFFG